MNEIVMEIVERVYSYRMRVWDIWVNEDHIGVVKVNKESENMSFYMDYPVYAELYAKKAMNMVKDRLIDEILLEGEV